MSKIYWTLIQLHAELTLTYNDYWKNTHERVWTKSTGKSYGFPPNNLSKVLSKDSMLQDLHYIIGKGVECRKATCTASEAVPSYRTFGYKSRNKSVKDKGQSSFQNPPCWITGLETTWIEIVRELLVIC